MKGNALSRLPSRNATAFRFHECDHCDGLVDYGYYRGYVVYQPEQLRTDAPHYVFPSQAAAAI
ncbi:MAG: hypothetical protein KJO07_25180 [Deltaproteobacteria bacterium]|nr:hypothetical protein [Deltaproteobacteria bacterium]